MFKNKKVENFVDIVIGLIYYVITETFDRLGELLFFALVYLVLLALCPFLLIYSIITAAIRAGKEGTDVEGMIKK